MDKKFDFSIVEKAGLTQTEFANLVEVNRITVNNWVRGRTNPHKIWHDRCRKQLGLLRAAVKLKLLPGDLPKPGKNVAEERARKIRATLRKVEKQVRAAKKKQPRK
jgi:transcriptional regulator with XRE-family HTH domain